MNRPPAQVHVHADQRDDGHDDADERDVDPHIAVDHVVGELARLAVHDVLGLRVDAHGQGRGGVGQQVDPQQLRGEQRQGHAGGLGWVMPSTPASMTPPNTVNTSPTLELSR